MADNSVRAGVITTAIVAVGGLWLGLTGSWPRATPPPSGSDFRAPARYVCAGFVERLSRNPASLEFIDRWDWPTTDNGDGTLTVLMHYRAQNGFGGMNRERRTCKVARTGDNYRLVSLSDPF